MKPIKRIMVATDFSSCAGDALEYAAFLAKALGVELMLVHVFERPLYFDIGVAHSLQLRHDVDEWLRTEKEEATKRVEALAAEISGSAKPTVIVRDGSPFLEIVAAAEEHNADLIVLGTHGRTGLPHIVLGSVAERVVRHAKCPVLTIRSSPSARGASKS